MRRIWTILPMALASNVNSIALTAGPLFCLQLRISPVNFNFVYDNHMVSNTMGLVAGFWTIFNVSISHMGLQLEVSLVAFYFLNSKKIIQ